MAILEVGAGKQFYSIQKAIDNAAANDEIYIYGGVYNEYIVCEKKLVLKGFPDDKENFSSYPIIYNSANIGHCFFLRMYNSKHYLYCRSKS